MHLYFNHHYYYYSKSNLLKTLLQKFNDITGHKLRCITKYPWRSFGLQDMEYERSWQVGFFGVGDDVFFVLKTPSYCGGVEARSRPRCPARPRGIPDELTQ